MAKNRKKKTSGVQQISPTKYIQTRARQLPIMECLINEDWEEAHTANITIARKHTNGNITYTNYLVDLLCLGVKDSNFKFNQTPIEYEEYKQLINESLSFISIDYTLAHNIIFAGYEFAIELGIEPCKTFSQTTHFMLEEDNDDVELIDIECGENGVPVIFKGEYNAREALDTYHQLCNTIGKDGVIFKDLEEEDDLLSLSKYLYKNPEKERPRDIRKLKRFINNLENITDEVSNELNMTVDRLFYNYYGYEKIDESRENICSLFDVDFTNELSDRVLGFSQEAHPDWLKVVNKTIELIQEHEEVNIETLINQHPQIPFLKYIHVKEMEFNSESMDEESHILEQLNQYITEHPHYFLLQLIRESYLIRNNEEAQIIPAVINQGKQLSELFQAEEFISTHEFLAFVLALHEYFIIEEDLLAIDSLVNCMEYDYPAILDSIEIVIITNKLIKTHFCKTEYL
ncbi:hypothetical protein DMA11_21130 [Marinilabiliaceae bacterium JC017]|nr:hypothetical protein DMA11_21130 [Marinilabiliaceae bacterium JC017]